MPVYKYLAVNAQKQRVKGKYIAENEQELATALAANNLYLVSAAVHHERPASSFSLGTGKAGLADLSSFCRQFAIMVTAGITLVECLECLKKQNYTATFKNVLQTIYEDVKGGAMLSEAIDKHKRVFPSFFRSMVFVGEASGRLDTVFVALADYYESDAAIRRKAKSALAYPMMLMGMTVAIAILMMTFVIPTFKETMGEMEVAVEGFTKTVYDTSDFIVANWKILLIAVIFVVVAVGIFMQTKPGKYAFDVFKIRCPYIGRVTTDLITARFSRAFSILLASGMDLATALDTVAGILGNRYLQKRFERAVQMVRQGTALTDAMRYYKIFPEMMLQMIAVGERTASLDEVLARSCSYFDQRVEASLNSVTAKIQPVMLLIMGGVIGSLFLAVYSPMLSIMNGL